MLIADRPVPVFPAPVTYRSQRTSKTALGRDLHHHVLASARPFPHVGQAEKVELGAIRLRMPCALRPSRAKVDKTRLVGVERDTNGRRPTENVCGRTLKDGLTVEPTFWKPGSKDGASTP